MAWLSVKIPATTVLEIGFGPATISTAHNPTGQKHSKKAKTAEKTS
jgi:hypothetical protein